MSGAAAGLATVLAAGTRLAGTTTSDEPIVTPGMAGFLVTLALVLACIPLIRSMVGKIRGVQYRDQGAADGGASAGDAADGGASGGGALGGAADAPEADEADEADAEVPDTKVPDTEVPDPDAPADDAGSPSDRP